MWKSFITAAKISENSTVKLHHCHSCCLLELCVCVQWWTPCRWVSTLLGQPIPIIQVQEMKPKTGHTLTTRHISAVEHANHDQDVHNYRGSYSTHMHTEVVRAPRWTCGPSSRVESTLRWFTVGKDIMSCNWWWWAVCSYLPPPGCI